MLQTRMDFQFSGERLFIYFFLKKHVVYTVVVVGYFDFFLSYFESTIMFCDMILTILAIYLATKPSFKVEKFNGMCTVYYFTYSVNFGKYFGNILQRVSWTAHLLNMK